MLGLEFCLYPRGDNPPNSFFEINKDCSNNKAKYEALILGLEILVKKGIKVVEIIGDSQFIIKQV